MIAFMAIPGCCAVAANGVLRIKRRPLLRDISFYFTALCCLCVFFHDGTISTTESGILVSIYAIFLVTLVSAPRIRRCYRACLGKEVKAYVGFVEQARGQHEVSLLEEARQHEQRMRSVDAARAASLGDAGIIGLSDEPFGDEAKNRSGAGANGHLMSIDDEHDELRRRGSTWSTADEQRMARLSRGSDHLHDIFTEAVEEEENPQGLRHRISHAFSVAISPLTGAFKRTCVPCEYGTAYENWWPLTFIVSFTWVSLFSFLISAVVQRWCELLGVADNVGFFGTAVVAIGAEIPDTIQSVTVAQKGYGSMAVSNSMGSQICNILFGLGLPWLLANLSGKEVTVHDPETLLFTAYLLASLVVVSCGTLLGMALLQCKGKAELTQSKGHFFLIMYVVALCVLGWRAFGR
jgi:Ca2+/Na+ antiporter